MPNRIIKESITTSATLARLSDAEERHFWRLLVQADDFGYLDARAEVIRARGYPMMLESVGLEAAEARTQALVKIGLLHLFQHGDKRYGHFPTWDQHQQKRAKYSKYPQVQSCEESCKQMISSDINSNPLPAYAPETLDIRNETLEARSEKREARKPPKPLLHPIASAAALLELFTEDELIQVKAKCPGVDLDWEAGKCIAWHNDRGGSGNWKLSWKNWLGRVNKPSNNGSRPTTRGGMHFDNSLAKFIEQSKTDTPIETIRRGAREPQTGAAAPVASQREPMP